MLRFTIVLLAFASGAAAQADPVSRSWNQPIEPFRMIDNVYYVGAARISAFLITTPAGHILTDGGFAETAPIILNNIRKLGFNPRDVRYLFNSHAHSDHAGGLAALKRATGAKLLAPQADAALLAAGGRGDFRFGDSMVFPPVTVDSIVTDQQRITLGGKSLIVHHTPGHTRGCMSWSMHVNDGGVERAVLFTCSTSILDYRFAAGKESYPGIRADFERTFQRLRSLPCDVMLAPHGDFFELTEKRQRMGSAKNPWVDPALCKRYLRQQEKAFRAAATR